MSQSHVAIIETEWSTSTPEALAERLGLTRAEVMRIAVLARVVSWEEQLPELSALWRGKVPLAEIAERLGRKANAVQIAASKHGLPRRSPRRIAAKSNNKKFLDVLPEVRPQRECLRCGRGFYPSHNRQFICNRHG